MTRRAQHGTLLLDREAVSLSPRSRRASSYHHAGGKCQNSNLFLFGTMCDLALLLSYGPFVTPRVETVVEQCDGKPAPFTWFCASFRQKRPAKSPGLIPGQVGDEKRRRSVRMLVVLFKRRGATRVDGGVGHGWLYAGLP